MEGLLLGKYQWLFPVNAAGGQPEGLNDSGVESFRGNQIESLAREIIQNSTDAKRDKNKPVTVSFQKFTVKTKEFPGKEGLLQAFESCEGYKRTPDQSKEFFKKGIDILKKKEITFLRISDFNTTGLLGIDKIASDWENLVKSVGISNKGGSAGGSFGIGKSAPFACSNIRTVFYRTYNQEAESAFQGVSRLASHSDGENETRGTGFYGRKELTKPIITENDFPNWFSRTEFGTDIFIASFINDNYWKEKIVRAVIENFFMAIYDKKLVVKVADIVISDSNLKMLIDKYVKSNKKLFANEFYSAIVFGIKHEQDILDLGAVRLYLQKNDDFSKKVAMVRSTGMKITYMDRFRGGTRFSGVLLIQGDKLNRLLRKIEPPAHDKWEPSRHEDPKHAETVIREIKQFVRNSVKSMNKVHEENKIDFKGFNRFLPDYLNKENPLDDQKIENEESKFVPKSMKVSTRRNRKKDRTEISTKKSNKHGHSRNRRDKNKKRKNAGDNKHTKPQAKLNVTKVRSIMVSGDKGTYDLMIGTKRGGQGMLNLNFVGEDARSYKTTILSANDLNTNQSLGLKNNVIGPVEFEDGGKKIIRVELDEKLRASLEVLINES